MNSKELNTMKRFRQGRITYKKMKNLMKTYNVVSPEQVATEEFSRQYEKDLDAGADEQAALARTWDGVAADGLQHKHIHGENCNH